MDQCNAIENYYSTRCSCGRKRNERHCLIIPPTAAPQAKAYVFGRMAAEVRERRLLQAGAVVVISPSALLGSPTGPQASALSFLCPSTTCPALPPGGGGSGGGGLEHKRQTVSHGRKPPPRRRFRRSDASPSGAQPPRASRTETHVGTGWSNHSQ